MNYKNLFVTLSVLPLSCLAFAVTTPIQNSVTSSLEVTLKSSTDNKAQGKIKFVQLKNNEVHISGDVSGLAPGEHGMHVHAVGDCSDIEAGFKKSGSHFNPDDKHHGDLGAGHTGDLGNIHANEKGIAHIEIQTSQFNLNENNPHSILNKAIVIHAGEDDKKTDPAGNSGNRIFCGVIK